MNVSLSKNDHYFLFNANIIDPIVLIKNEFRSENEYDNDIFAEKTALKYIEKISQCFEGNTFLLIASSSPSHISKLRSKKGLIWNDKELRKLEHYDNELEMEDKKTRLSSLINLNNFNYNTSEEFVLGWISSLIILTNEDINIIRTHVKNWISKDNKSLFPFNNNAIVKDLLDLNETVILRYFPADNGKNETLIAVGNRDYINNNVEKCLKLISRN